MVQSFNIQHILIAGNFRFIYQVSFFLLLLFFKGDFHDIFLAKAWNFHCLLLSKWIRIDHLGQIFVWALANKIWKKLCPVKSCFGAQTNKKLNNNAKINTEYFLTLDSYSQQWRKSHFHLTFMLDWANITSSKFWNFQIILNL